MALTYGDLVDRCKVFAPEANRNALLKFLFEAVRELTRRVDILYYQQSYTTTASTETISIGEPAGGSSDILFKEAVWCEYEGRRLQYQEESEFDRDSDNDLYEGSPTGYAIRYPATIVLNRKPSATGDDVDLGAYYYYNHDYFSALTTASNVVTENIFAYDLCYFAISMVLAATDPGRSDKYLLLWEDAVEKINYQHLQRGISNFVKEEV